MTAPADTIHSYSHGTAHREDLEDVIYNIDPTDTPFHSNVNRTRATGITHEWQTDVLDTAQNNAQVTGDDAPNDVRPATVRLQSPTQISRRVFGVSGSDQAANKAGMSSRIAYESTKNGLELKRDMEHTSTNPYASAMGDATTARQSAGYMNWCSTNNDLGATGAIPGYSAGVVGAITDGTNRPMDEAVFKGVIKQVYDSGGKGEFVLCGSTVKQDISAFTGIATRFRDVKTVGPTEIIGAADVYVSDFYSEHRIVPSRFHAAESCGILTTDLWSIATLRGMEQERLAKTGDSERRMVICEWTTVSRNEKGSGVVMDIGP